MREIFEPMNPIWHKEVQTLTGWDETPLYPRAYYLPAKTSHAGWQTFWQKTLTGQTRSPWTDVTHTPLFPKRYLVKVIRANMMLGFVCRHFNPHVVYITRHPCATIVSRLAKNWSGDLFFLLEQVELVEDYLRPWLAEIERISSPVEGHAVWWAVENRIAQDDLEAQTGKPALCLTYEQLCLEPKIVVQNLMNWLNEPIPPYIEAQVERPSWQARPDIIYNSTEERLSAWKKQLGTDEQQTILKWAHRFGIDHYH